MRSKWVTFERHSAFIEDPTNLHGHVIPILLDDTSIPITLSQFAYIDWRVPSEVEYKKLLTSCLPKPEKISSQQEQLSAGDFPKRYRFCWPLSLGLPALVVTVSIICFWLWPEPPTGASPPKLPTHKSPAMTGTGLPVEPPPRPPVGDIETPSDVATSTAAPEPAPPSIDTNVASTPNRLATRKGGTR